MERGPAGCTGRRSSGGDERQVNVPIVPDPDSALRHDDRDLVTGLERVLHDQRVRVERDREVPSFWEWFRTSSLSPWFRFSDFPGCKR